MNAHLRRKLEDMKRSYNPEADVPSAYCHPEVSWSEETLRAAVVELMGEVEELRRLVSLLQSEQMG